MGRTKRTKGEVKVGYFLSKEVVEKLDRVTALLTLKGKKMTKSEIVEEALREKLEKLERKLERGVSDENK